MLELIGMILALLCIMSIALTFDKKKTTKSIIITGIITLFVWAFFNIPGRLDGNLISWQLFLALLLHYLFWGSIAMLVTIFIIIKDRLYEKKWYTKTLPWGAGVFYGLIFAIMLPLVIKEQINLYKDYQQTSTEVEQVSKVYGFLLSKDLISDWCYQHYILQKYPMKFAEEFGEIQYNARKFLVDSLTKHGESLEAIDSMEVMLAEVAYNTYEQDYLKTKQNKESTGKKYTKKDFCKMIDEKADMHISNTQMLFKELISNL